MKNTVTYSSVLEKMKNGNLADVKIIFDIGNERRCFMTKVLIYDCAAESGGALTILKQYYEKCFLEKKCEYYFIVSVVALE